MEQLEPTVVQIATIAAAAAVMAGRCGIVEAAASSRSGAWGGDRRGAVAVRGGGSEGECARVE